jgi:hypothetical protein
MKLVEDLKLSSWYNLMELAVIQAKEYWFLLLQIDLKILMKLPSEDLQEEYTYLCQIQLLDYQCLPLK